MSVEISAHVWKRFPGVGSEMLLALALADHADDEGKHIFPSVPNLAVKSRQSERSVQRYLRKMEEDGWLICVRRSRGGPYRTSEYRINQRWIDGIEYAHLKVVDKAIVIHNGDNLSPLENDLTVTPMALTVTPVSVNGDIAVSPESSLTIKNHHLSARASADESISQPPDPMEAVVDVLQRAGVQVSSGNQALRDLLHQGLTVREAADCASIARQKKPGESIPWAYLAKVIQTQREQGLACRSSASGGAGEAWWLDAERIAAKAYELRIVNVTLTDRRQMEDQDFQYQVLERAGVAEEVWAQWRAWHRNVA